MKSFASSTKRRALMIRSLLLFSTLGVGACQTTLPRTEVPSAFRLTCDRPAGVNAVKTVGDLAAYSVRQDAALKVCEAKLVGLVSIIDAMNNTPKRGWWPWFEREASVP